MLALNLGPLFQVYAASDRIKELIDVPTSQKGSFKPSGEVKGNLQIEHVNFSYPQNEDIQVLKDVSIHVDNGKNRVVALVGYSGCGKSSIISLIEQFYKPTQGAVLFNGINIETLDPAWYH